jgi:hypothetical protein
VGGADAAGTPTHLWQECAGQPGYEWAVDIKGTDTFHYLNLFTQECGLPEIFRKISDAGWNSDSTCGQKEENLGLSVQIDSATVAPQCLEASKGALVVTLDGAKQGLCKDAIASPADTSPLNFENTFDILSIAEARWRPGSIEVETNISAMDAASLHALSSILGLGHSIFAKFNAELTTFGDPASTVVSVKSKKSDLCDGAVAGMVIGSVACAAILFGAALCLTKVKNKTSSEYLAGKAKVMMDGAQKKSEEREDAAGKVGRKSNHKNHRVRVSEEVAGAQGVCTDTPAKTGMIST